MLQEILPFNLNLDKAMIAASCLWSLALYVGLASVRDFIIEQLERWMNFAERWLYTSVKEFNEARTQRESQNAFYSSILSVLPFLALGGLCNYGVEIGLGRSWSISTGILACMACGIYELGRQSQQQGDDLE